MKSNIILIIALMTNSHSYASPEQFNSFLKSSWDEDLRDSPEFAYSIGEKGFADKWSDYGMEGIEHRKQKVRNRYQFLKKFDRSSLPPQDQVNFDLLLSKYEISMKGLSFPNEYFAISQLGGIHTRIPAHLDRLPNKTAADFEIRKKKLLGIPKIVDQSMQVLKKGAEKGITPYHTSIKNVPKQLDGILQDFDKSPITMAYRDRPTAITKKQWIEIRNEAKTIYNQKVLPSFSAFKKFFVNEYLTKSRKKPGLSSLTNYPDWYQHRILQNTTLPLTAKEVHKIGIREVKNLKERMKIEMRAAKHKGDLKSFIRHLKTDPKFFFGSEEDLLNHYMITAKKIDMGMPTLFETLPRLPYGIKKIPDYKAPSSPTAYYQSGHLHSGRAGIFYANTYDLKSRPNWEIPALTLHEAVPGHHHQISVAQELEGIPQFRKYMHHTAFTEGWALYAETLGYDIDLYQDPYSRFGQLNYDMWRSIRLVVDTGIHAMGWSREKAITYFKNNSALTDKNIEVEVDRYIAWPGQALGYKIGQLTILDLRKKAVNNLGKGFNIRKFHTQLLENGSVPLDYLKSYMTGKIGSPKS